MPPRTTRKSHRRTVSDRTMVGTAQPLCLSASETEGRRYEMTMNLGKSEITAPHNNAGLDDEIASSRRGSVFLDIPFYRTGFRTVGLSRRDHVPRRRLHGSWHSNDTRSFTAKKTFKLSSFPTGETMRSLSEDEEHHGSHGRLAARENSCRMQLSPDHWASRDTYGFALATAELSRNPSVAAQLRGACSCHFEMRTAILLPAAFIGLRAEGPFFSVADRFNSVNGHSLRY